MLDFLFEYRGLIVGFIFIGLIVAIVSATVYGRRLIKIEKSDAIFGDPERALGGWHWVITGVSAIMLIWFYFSWDAARAFFPQAANELCQVGKLDYAINPIRSTFALDNSYLRGSSLIERENKQISGFRNQLESLELNPAQNTSALATIALMEKSLQALSKEEYLDASSRVQIKSIENRIIQLTANLKDDSYPGEPTAEQVEKANSQARWGDSGNEIPIHPASPRGYKFDAAAKEMLSIATEFATVRNKNTYFLTQVEQLKAEIENISSITAETGKSDNVLQLRKDYAKSLTRVLRRIDDGLIFPPNAMDGLEKALVDFEDVQQDQKGGLAFIDAWFMPGGKVKSGSSSCSEQGAGRWLPKPSDTLRTMTRISDPDIGYKGYPLLWYKQKPFGEMVDFIMPDFISSLVPGDFPRHTEDGKIGSNFKSKVHKFVTGEFDSFTIPVPSGHIWDSLLRVLAGLFFGILLGVPLGLFMGLSRFSKGFFDPLIELYRPVPPLAWAPLILTIFGIGDDGKIFLLFMVAFAIMVISARTGASGTHLSKIRAAHSLGATNQQILRRVILPNSLPEILTGIRIAIGVCWGTLVAAEMLAGTTGIGFVENVARKQSDYEIIWTTIIILGLLGLMFDLIMRWIIDRVIPWRGKG